MIILDLIGLLFPGGGVIEQTTRQKLPLGFQTCEFLFQHGLIDRVESRAELRSLLRRLLAGGVARIGGRPIVIITRQNGHSTKDLVAYNFGLPRTIRR